jgi:hypothetical protein
MRFHSVAFALITASVTSTGFAQSAVGVTGSSARTIHWAQPTVASTTVQTAERQYGSFVLQALGGTIGSAAGLAVGLATINECDGDDDLACGLEKASVTGALGVIGATTAVVFVGRAAAERPSIVGSLLGGVAGSAVGVGLHHLITEEMSQNLPDAGTFALFTITQGVLAAAGGRIGAMMRARR